jgi:hypothetical protein
VNEGQITNVRRKLVAPDYAGDIYGSKDEAGYYSVDFYYPHSRHGYCNYSGPPLSEGESLRHITNGWYRF